MGQCSDFTYNNYGMKNKKLTIGLLIAVVAIWSTVFIKVFNYHDDTVVKYNYVPKKYNTINMLDTYALSYYDKDPFLKIISDTASEVNTPNNNIVLPPKPRPLLPEYVGYIIQEKEATVILKDSKHYIFLKKGEKNNEMRLVKITDSVIVVSINYEEFAIKKSDSIKKLQSNEPPR